MCGQKRILGVAQLSHLHWACTHTLGVQSIRCLWLSVSVSSVWLSPCILNANLGCEVAHLPILY